MTDQPSWAVAVTEPGRDLTAEQSLRRDGYRVIFLYRRKLITGHRGDWRNTHAFVSRPLFEGYGFVQLWPGQEWPQPARVAGFSGLVGGSSPVWIDDETIRRWQERTQLGEFDDRVGPIGKDGTSPKYRPANSEEERNKIFAELMQKIGAQYEAAS